MSTRVEQLIDRVAAVAPDRLALAHGQRRWTYRQVQAECDRRAGVLIAAGLRIGDLVVVAEPASDEVTLAFLACCRAGGVFVTLSPLLTAAELHTLSALAQPAFALTADGTPRAGLTAPLTLSLALPGLPTRAALAEAARRSDEGDASVLAAIRNTSGTTGTRAKLVVRTHRQLTWQNADDREHAEARVVCCYTPNQFMSGVTCHAFAVGATLVLPLGGRAESVEEDLVRHGVTALHTVPALLGALVRQPQPPPAGLRLQRVRVVAATLPAEVKRAGEARYAAPIITEYAMSECRAIMMANDPATPAGSIGVPQAGTEVRLLDLAGAPVPSGAIGELVIRSPNVMAGYHNDPEATASALRDGWLWTGDLARQDAAGCYYLAGRRALRINVGGYKVAPEEIEAVLLQHPGVLEAVVIALPDARHGEVVRAVIVPRQPSPQVAELRRFCQARLANYKVPRRFEFRESLPHSALGKIVRHLV